jgi:hypothetical protein
MRRIVPFVLWSLLATACGTSTADTTAIDGAVTPPVSSTDSGLATTTVPSTTTTIPIPTTQSPSTPTVPPPPVEVERESGYWYPEFTGDVDGVPTLFYSGLPVDVDPDTWLCPPGWALNGYVLATGEESAFVCLPIEDAGFDIYSFGGGRFVGTPYGQCGVEYTFHSIQFWDTSGTEVEAVGNPFPPDRDCAPCELAALLSDDGTMLAYRHRPDAFWPGSINYRAEHFCSSDHDDYDGWWEKSSLTPATVAVVDLATGEVLWSTEVGADVQLGDFDGRYIVLHRRDWSSHPHVWVDIRIVDTWGEHTDIVIGTPSVVVLVGGEQ